MWSRDEDKQQNGTPPFPPCPPPLPLPHRVLILLEHPGVRTKVLLASNHTVETATARAKEAVFVAVAGRDRVACSLRQHVMR